MKLENLEAGMKIKNYKKLCELMDEPEKSGASKRAQVNEWERYVFFERQGNAFIIKEIRDVPLPSSDGRKKYMQYVEPLLLHTLSRYNPGFGEIERTFENWTAEIGLTSGRAYDEEVLDEYRTLVSSGYGRVEPVFSTIAIQRARYEIAHRTKTALITTAESLKRKGIIRCKSKMYVVQKHASRPASTEEELYIKQAKQRVLDAMQLSSMFYVQISPKKTAEYYERLNELYHEEKGWDRTYELYAVEGIDWQQISAYAAIELNTPKDCFRKEFQKAVHKKLTDEVKVGNELNLQVFEKMGEEDFDGKFPFAMDHMLAHDIEYLIEKLL